MPNTTNQTKKRTKTTKSSAVNKSKTIVSDLGAPPSAEKSAVGVSPARANVKIFDFVIQAGVFLIFFLVPLFFTGLTVAGPGFEKMLLFFFVVLASAAAWAAKVVIGGELKLKRTPMDLPIAAVAIIAIAATVMSVNQKVSLFGIYGNPAKGLAALVVFIVFYYLMINNIDVKKAKTLFYAFAVSASLAVFYSLFQLFGIFLLPFGFTKTTAFNPIGLPSELAMFISVVLPILVFAAVKGEKDAAGVKRLVFVCAKILAGTASLAGVALLVFLSGVTFWPAAIAGMATVLLFVLSKTVKISGNNLFLPIVVFLLLVVFWTLGASGAMNANLPPEVRLSREMSWDIAKNSVKSNPILGSGPSTFYYGFSKFKSADFNDTPFWNARFSSASGFLFEILADIGILGALAIIFALITGLYVGYKSIIQAEDEETKSVLLPLFSGFVTVLVLASLFPFSGTMVLISVLLLSLAASVSAGGKEIVLSLHSAAAGEMKRKQGMSLAATFMVVSAAVVALFVFGAKMYLADFYAKKSLQAETLEKKAAQLEKAVKFAPYRDIYYINLADSYAAAANKEAAKRKDRNKISDYLNKAVIYARAAVEMAPEKSGNNEFLALVYENAAMYTDGGVTVWAKSLEDLYGKMIEVDPNNPVPYFKLALLNAARADVAKQDSEKEKFLKAALDKYDLATAKKSDFAQAYYGKGVIYEKLNNIDEAINQLKLAVNNANSNKDYAFELGRLYLNRGISKAETVKQEQNTTDKKEEQLSKNDSGSQENKDKLTVEADSGSVQQIIKRNKDINIANQIFLSILRNEKKHANALYSLTLLYNAVGEKENAKITLNKLLEILQNKEQKNRVREQFRDLLK